MDTKFFEWERRLAAIREFTKESPQLRAAAPQAAVERVLGRTLSADSEEEEEEEEEEERGADPPLPSPRVRSALRQWQREAAKPDSTSSASSSSVSSAGAAPRAPPVLSTAATEVPVTSRRLSKQSPNKIGEAGKPALPETLLLTAVAVSAPARFPPAGTQATVLLSSKVEADVNPPTAPRLPLVPPPAPADAPVHRVTVPSLMSLSSPLLPPPPPTAAVPTFLLSAFLRHGDGAAITSTTTGDRTTYRRLASVVRIVAAGLARDGFHKHDILSIAAPNVPLYPVAALAAIALGGVAAPLSFATVSTAAGLSSTPGQAVADSDVDAAVRAVARHYLVARPAAVVTVSSCLAAVTAALHNAGHVAKVYILDGGGGGDGIPFSRLLCGGVAGFPERIRIDVHKDPAVLLHMEAGAPSAPPLPLSHAHVVSLLASASASSSPAAVDACVAACVGVTPPDTPHAHPLVDDVKHAVERVLVSCNTLISDALTPSQAGPETGKVRHAGCSRVGPAYAPLAAVDAVAPWHTPFGLVFGLLVPLLEGCSLRCGGTATPTCDILVADDAETVAGALAHPAASVGHVIMPRAAAPVAALCVSSTQVWSVHPSTVALSHIVHLPAGASLRGGAIGVAAAGVSCSVVPSTRRPGVLQLAVRSQHGTTAAPSRGQVHVLDTPLGLVTDTTESVPPPRTPATATRGGVTLTVSLPAMTPAVAAWLDAGARASLAGDASPQRQTSPASLISSVSCGTWGGAPQHAALTSPTLSEVPAKGRRRAALRQKPLRGRHHNPHAPVL